MTASRSPSLTLYAARMSSATPVVAAIDELGVDCRIELIDLASKDQKKPEYLKLNPNGVVPTLVVDGTPMFEAIAIMQWLGDRFGVARGLWPAADQPERLQALSWTTWAYVTYGGFIRVLNCAQGANVDASLHQPKLAAEMLNKLRESLDMLEAHLAGRTWLLGEQYSLADLIVASVVLWSTFCGVSLDGHARVREWVAAYQARQSFRTAWAA